MITDETPTLYSWEARRAGGRITIIHKTGKVTSIDAIEVLDGRVIATRSCGSVYILDVPSS